MYVKTSVRKTRNGEVRYLQLAHNEWDAVKRPFGPRVIHGFGREDQLDRGAIRRLVVSLTRLLEPGQRPDQHDHGRVGGVGVHVVPPGRRHAGPGRVVAPAGDRHRHDGARLPAGLRETAARSGCCSRWSRTGHWRRVRSSPPRAGSARCAHIDGLAEASDDACYRAMDWLLEIAPDLEREVFWQVATLLDHEVDLLFFDTTSTYFETDHPDGPVARDTRGRPAPTRRPPPPRAPPRASGARTTRDGVGFRDLRQVQGLPRRPAAGRDRHGGHPGRDPGPGVVLAGEHRRLRR